MRKGCGMPVEARDAAAAAFGSGSGTGARTSRACREEEGRSGSGARERCPRRWEEGPRAWKEGSVGSSAIWSGYGSTGAWGLHSHRLRHCRHICASKEPRTWTMSRPTHCESSSQRKVAKRRCVFRQSIVCGLQRRMPSCTREY